MPEVVLLLEAEPEVRPVAAELAEAEGHPGADGGLLSQDAVQRLARDAKLARRPAHREAEGGQHVQAQDGPGVDGGS